MSFIIEDGDADTYTRYNKIWKKISSIMKVKFTISPVYDEKYIGARLKTFKEQNNTIFTDINDQIVVMPKENVKYSCIPVIGIDSVFKIDDKVYPQIYLRQCKYRAKKLRFTNFINTGLVESDEE